MMENGLIKHLRNTLQQINEGRAAEAKDRWKHLRSGHEHSADKAPTKKGYSSAELTWSNSAKESRDRNTGFSDKRTLPGYGYGDSPYEEKKEIDYIWFDPKPKDPGANYKEGKFPKIDEAIRNLKNGKR